MNGRGGRRGGTPDGGRAGTGGRTGRGGRARSGGGGRGGRGGSPAGGQRGSTPVRSRSGESPRGLGGEQVEGQIVHCGVVGLIEQLDKGGIAGEVGQLAQENKRRCLQTRVAGEIGPGIGRLPPGEAARVAFVRIVFPQTAGIDVEAIHLVQTRVAL